MSLLSLIGRKKLILLGLNSGTSGDGLDLAVVRVTRQKTKVRSEYIYGKVRSYSEELKQQLLHMADCQTIELEELIALDRTLGIFFGRQANLVINRMKKQNINIDLIASHGQTIRHLPRYFGRGNNMQSGTLQIGSLEQIASITSLPVIGDFRQSDIAVGGEGAPITGPALQRLLGHGKQSQLVVNIGGMSNFFYFPSENLAKHAIAQDCGPGNTLINILSERLFDKPFDQGGRLAKKGNPSDTLIDRLVAETALVTKAISTGREMFGPSLVDLMIKSKRELKLSNYDLLATTTEFTVRSIVRSVKPIVDRDQELKKLYLTGGGRHNHYMINRLAGCLQDIKVLSIDAAGLNGDLVEAASFALLGEAALRSEPLAVSRRKGRQPIGGRIVQPPMNDSASARQR